MSVRKIVKSLLPKSLFSSIEPYGHQAEAVIAQIKYKFPGRNMQVIGVTGTDGKTTTCSLIASVLRAGGYKVGVITTAYIDYGDGKGEQTNTTNLTTGNTFDLNRLVSQIKANGVDWLILEASSHALNQRRVWGIPFSIAVMTNMSPEHLDYHKTFDKYRQAKQLLFRQCNKNRKGLRIGIVNNDDTSSDYFKNVIQNPVTYGVNAGQIQATNIQSTLTGNRFRVTLDADQQEFHTQLIGDFNVYNALAAIAVGQSIGMKPDDIAKGLEDLPMVQGRMMILEEGQNFKVVIDYAVTPGAMQHVLKTVHQLANGGSIHIVFGATGDRDKSKRPEMGRVASELADHVYLTNDETYTEDAESIQQQVMSGVAAEHLDKVRRFTQRKEAIKSALETAREGDVVIVSGIGHQSTINMGGKKIQWSDIDQTRALLKDLTSNKGN